MNILPAIDILGGKVVRLAKGNYAHVTVYQDDPVEQAKCFQDSGAHWLHIVDLDGAKSGNVDNLAVIERILATTELKVQVGGGLRSMKALERLADAGATYMVLGTALVRNPEFAQAAVAKYGNRLVAGIDAKSGNVAVEGWTEKSDISAFELAGQMAALGYEHLVYTDIARDGMKTGIDVTAYVKMAHAFGHPVIASGGVADLNDIRALTEASNAIEGVIVGRALYEGSFNLKSALELCWRNTGGLNNAD